jgi:hypothetical protein
MTWRFENMKEQVINVHNGMIALNILFATAISGLAIYFLL